MSYYKKTNNLRENAEEVTALLRTKFTNSEGLFFQGRVKEEVIADLIIDDFGDVAPFIAMYGGEDMCKTHLDYLEKNLSNLGFVRAFAYTDLILGLVWYSRIGKYSKQAIKLAEVLSLQVEEQWMKNGKIYSQKIGNTLLPITNGIDTTFVEVWTELFRETGDERYKNLAIKSFLYFKNIRENNRIGLIPTHFAGGLKGLFGKYLFKKKFSEIHVMKDNTNYLFALLDMIRLDIAPEDALVEFSAIHSILSSYANSNSLNNNLVKDSASDLVSSFAFIDVSCDAYALTNNQDFLNSAQRFANTWLSLPKTKTGLFPKNYSASESYLDCETDMAIALLKLFELSAQEKYKNKAVELFQGIMDYHWTAEGLVTCVQIQSGEITSRVVKTKFVALFIKLLHVLSSDKNIYQNEELFMLLKDR